MPIFLFFVGAIAVAAGVGMIGYGIPVREFSFGNTLIIAGTTAAVGGLVLIGVGAVVSQLRRIAETLAAQPVSSRRPFETFEPPAGPRAAPMSNRMPGPPGKPQSEGRKLPPAMEASAPAAIRGDNRPASVPAPKLQNPDRQGATGQEVEIGNTKRLRRRRAAAAMRLRGRATLRAGIRGALAIPAAAFARGEIQ